MVSKRFWGAKFLIANWLFLLLAPALAQSNPIPRIGVLRALPQDYGVLGSCTFTLERATGKPILDRTLPQRTRINLDGQDLTLKRLRVVYARPQLSSLDELRQEIFTGNGVRVIVDYRIITSGFDGVGYIATITAIRGKQRSTVTANGFYGCPRHP